MKFIIYLYYLIYKVSYRFGYFFYDHSPLTPKDKSKRKGEDEEWLEVGVDIQASSFFYIGFGLYIVCFLILMYICGFTQIKTFIDETAKHKDLVIAIYLIITYVIDYFLLERNHRFERCSEEFSHYSVEKKMLYGSVALALFVIPIIGLYYELNYLL